MAWFYLILAGLLEIGWAIGMKYTNGFTRLWPTAATFATMTVSFYLLSLSLKTIPMGTAYAVSGEVKLNISYTMGAGLDNLKVFVD